MANGRLSKFLIDARDPTAPVLRLAWDLELKVLANGQLVVRQVREFGGR